VTIRPAGAERIRGPPPRHRAALRGDWEEERGPPLSGRRYDHDDQPAAKRPPRGAAAAAPAFASHPPPFVVVERPDGELGRCRGGWGALPRAPFTR